MKIDFHTLMSIINPTERMGVMRGCEAARNGGCGCTGRCTEIIGYYENGVYTSTEDPLRKKEIGFTSYPLNSSIQSKDHKRTEP